MNRKQLRNEKCRCGSGLKFKNCCGRISSQLYHDMPEDLRQRKEKEFQKFYKMFKSLQPIEYSRMGLPNLKDLDFVKMVLDCWDSEKFRKAVYVIDGRSINPEQMTDKKNQLLNMSEGVKIQTEIRFITLHMPHYAIFAYHIPKSFYSDPTLIVAYELYSDPVSIELRTYGSPYEIAKAMEKKS